MSTEKLSNEAKTPALNKGAVMRSVVWQPTQLLRWGRVMKDEGSYDKVLQQMWKGDLGEQEWRDVPEED
jgi:hypothetical protein